MSKDFLRVLCVILTANVIEYMILLVHVLFDILHEFGEVLCADALFKSCMDAKLMGKEGIDTGGVFDVVREEHGVVFIRDVERLGITGQFAAAHTRHKGCCLFVGGGDHAAVLLQGIINFRANLLSVLCIMELFHFLHGFAADNICVYARCVHVGFCFCFVCHLCHMGGEASLASISKSAEGFPCTKPRRREHCSCEHGSGGVKGVVYVLPAIGLFECVIDNGGCAHGSISFCQGVGCLSCDLCDLTGFADVADGTAKTPKHLHAFDCAAHGDKVHRVYDVARATRRVHECTCDAAFVLLPPLLHEGFAVLLYKLLVDEPADFFAVPPIEQDKLLGCFVIREGVRHVVDVLLGDGVFLFKPPLAAVVDAAPYVLKGFGDAALCDAVPEVCEKG